MFAKDQLRQARHYALLTIIGLLCLWQLDRPAVVSARSIVSAAITSSGDSATAESGPYSYAVDSGQQVDYTVAFYNSGSTSWYASSGYYLEDLSSGITYTVGSCDGLLPGWTCTWYFTFTAGSTPGTFSYNFQMVHSGVPFAATINATFTVIIPDNAQALSGPFNYSLGPGQQQVYLIQFQNTGSNSWTTAGGYALEGTYSGVTYSLGSCDGLAPGWYCTWSFTFTAGTTSGTYGYLFQMAHSGSRFGTAISATFNVVVIDGSQPETGPFSFSLSPGQQTVFPITFLNEGNSTWWSNNGYELEEAYSGTSYALGSCDGVAPGQSCTWNFTFTAGNVPTTFSYAFEMSRSGALFGPVISVTIVTTGVQVFVPNVLTSYGGIILNGGFEEGLAGWQTGGVLGVQVSTTYAHSGSYSALIGDLGLTCAGGVPIGNSSIDQTITLPNASSITLAFWYRIFTQDWTGSDPQNPKYDWFGVYIDSVDAAHHLFYDGNSSPSVGCGSPKDLGWRQGSLNLAQYAGQNVTLYFVTWNQGSGYYNTYTYVDDVTVTSP